MNQKKKRNTTLIKNETEKSIKCLDVKVQTKNKLIFPRNSTEKYKGK
jgi:hypothetical protein